MQTTSDTAGPKSHPLAFGIADFCQAHSISRSTFYELLHAGQAPDTMRVGGRVLISAEGAADWRQRMTQRSGAAR